MRASPTDHLDHLARRALDIDRLHDAQREAAHAAIGGRDVLAVLATGFGKSAIYQLAAMERPGPTVVVSPLLALQRDQLAHLDAADAGAAVAVSSVTAPRKRRDAFAALRAGDVEFVFLSPEQLQRVDVLDELGETRPSLAVVDEAHCVSAWGFDFRPDYMRLPAVIAALGRPPVLALTATAAPLVQDDIVHGLQLRRPAVVRGPFDRPNIELSARTFDSPSERDDATRAYVVEADACGARGIVYTSTRARATSLAGTLAERGVAADAFHAGLPRRVREDVHRRFTTGASSVVVATSAFGMGIDVPDVRFVLHADAPASLDAYAQEMGRAGRDGEPACAVLHHRDEDLALHAHLASRGRNRWADVAVVADRLGRTRRLPVDVLRHDTGLSARSLGRALVALQLLGAASSDPSSVHVVEPSCLEPTHLRDALEELESRRSTVLRTRRDMVRAYAQARGCRRRALRGYFGEEAPETCGACDNCARGVTARAATDRRAGPRLIDVDAAVVHATFGEGRVVRVDPDEIVVLFRDAGYRTLAVPHVLDEGILRTDPGGLSTRVVPRRPVPCRR